MSNLFVFLVVLALSSSPTLTLVKSDMCTIETTCKNTSYPDLCVSVLKSDPKSLTADTKGLATIIAGNATATATAAARYISVDLYGSSKDAVLKKAVKECGDKYSLATESLKLSVQALGKYYYEYANMHVTAAAAYPDACRSIFRQTKGLVYPVAISSREEALKRICEVAANVIHSLGE